jgi:lysyl-tRNA synthetase, class II
MSDTKNLSTSSIDFQRQVRLDKLNDLVKLKKNPFAVESHRDYNLAAVNQLFKEGSTLPSVSTVLAGRIKTIRMSGRIAFFVLEDESYPNGFQLILKKDQLLEETNIESLTFDEIKNLIDEGDYMQASGQLELSQRGQPSLVVDRINILTKALRPLPEELDYKNLEERYTNRVVDLKMNTQDDEGLGIREVIKMKAKYWEIWRDEMSKEGFLSVENPIFETIPGGAETKPFKTFYNELDQEMFLRISLELPLKKLIAGGFERVYEIGRVFRNESSSPQHLQDINFIEWYCAYTDYNWAATFVKKVFQRVVIEILGTNIQKDYYGGTIDWGEWCSQEEADKNNWDLEGGWPKIRYFDAVRYFSHGKIDTEGKSVEELLKMCQVNDINDVKIEDGIATLLDKLWKKARVNTTNPFFLILPPAELEPLAKRDPANPELVQRWQIVAGRAEHGKAFSELNDPIDQIARFESQQAARDAGNEEAQFMDEDYVRAMELGMPPLSGFGISDRFVSSLLGKHIKECCTFPYVKTIDNEKSRTMLASSIILDTPDIPMWSKLNAASHLSASLSARLGRKLIGMDSSLTKDKIAIPMNIQHAITNLSADSSKQLIDCMFMAKNLGLDYSVFTQDMRDSKNDEEVDIAHYRKSIKEITVLGLMIFGKKSDVENLTAKFEFKKME